MQQNPVSYEAFLHLVEGDLTESEADFRRAINIPDSNIEKIHSIRDQYFQIIEKMREEGHNSTEKFGLLTFIQKGENEIQRLHEFRQKQENEIQRLQAEAFKIWWAKKNYDKARAAFSESIAANPNDYWAWCAVAEVFLLSKETEQAISALNRAFQINSQDARIYYVFALLHLTLHELDLFKDKIALAIQIAQAYYENEPDDTCNVLELALYRLVDDQIDVAELLFRQAASGNITPTRIRTTIYDLQSFLTLSPNFSPAQQMIDLLETSIAQ